MLPFVVSIFDGRKENPVAGYVHSIWIYGRYGWGLDAEFSTQITNAGGDPTYVDNSFSKTIVVCPQLFLPSKPTGRWVWALWSNWGPRLFTETLVTKWLHSPSPKQSWSVPNYSEHFWLELAVDT